MGRCITCSWEAPPEASSNTAGARCYSCQLLELSQSVQGCRKNLRSRRKMNEKRGDEIVECAASAIRRLGHSGRNRNHAGGILSTPSFRPAPNSDGHRDLRRRSLALVKPNRDLCNRWRWFFHAAQFV